MRLVLVEWEDSHALTSGGWMHLDGEHSTDPRMCFSVGWLLADGERAKVIVPHRNEEPPGAYAQGAGAISIPTRCIVRIVDLREVGEERQATEAA
jgi:hypothetical protein